jgi:3-deoxy-D-manno-octulosonic acid kinase
LAAAARAYHRRVASFGAFVELRERGAIGWVHQDLAAHGLGAFWAATEPMAGAQGRGGVGRVRVGERDLVVRPYRRGGALGPLLRDRYARPSRARAELAVLDALRNEGVPVVTPIAAVARRERAFWRLRLCTELLPDALPLPAFLAARPDLRRYSADAVGTVVRLAFAAGLRHPDLHLDNVLCSARGDKVRAVLVDLDRAVIKKPLSAGQRDDMLVRMMRYVARHRSRMPAVPTRSEALRFLQALGLDRAARAAAWQRLAKKLQKALGRRRWLRR